jgi:branched-chain amino acid transport system permease protein
VSLSQVAAFLLIGLGSGALIAGVGLGVVLSYRGSGIINLAAGAIAMLAGFCYWALRTGHLGPTFNAPWAVVLTAVFSVVVGIVFELGIIRPLRRKTPLAKLVATLGVLLGAQAAVVLAFGPAARPQPQVLPDTDLSVFGEVIPLNRFLMAGILLVVTAALIALYQWSMFGLGTRAAAENEASAALLGLSPNRLSLLNTVLMSLIMGLVGLLAASVVDVDSSTLPLLVVPALAAAMFGRLISFGATFVAGILIGMAESLLTYFSTQSWFPNTGMVGNPIPGVQELLIFIILVIAMFATGGSIPGRGDVIDRRLPPAPRLIAPRRQLLTWFPLAAFALWALPSGFREGLITSLIAAIMLLSLVVITGYVGQLSVVQVALGGVAGFTISHFANNFGIGFPWGAILGVVFAVIVGVISGIPALRVRGVGLTVVTLAAAVAIENFGFANPTWGGGNGGSNLPPPSLFGFNFGSNATFPGLGGAEPSPLFGWFVLIVLCLVALFVCNLRRSTLGQEMLAVRANERAAAAIGINTGSVKLVGFALSAGIAGISGALLGYSYGVIPANSYTTLFALSLIAFGYIAGITSVPGAIFAAMLYNGGFVAFILLDWWGLQSNWLNFVGGILVIATLVFRPDGLVTPFFYPQRKPAQRQGMLGGRALGDVGAGGGRGEVDEAAREAATTL